MESLLWEEKNNDDQQRSTVFDSTGFALEDQVAVNMLLDYAQALQVGTWVSLESTSSDVKNPYSFVTAPQPTLQASVLLSG